MEDERPVIRARRAADTTKTTREDDSHALVIDQAGGSRRRHRASGAGHQRGREAGRLDNDQGEDRPAHRQGRQRHGDQRGHDRRPRDAAGQGLLGQGEGQGRECGASNLRGEGGPQPAPGGAREPAEDREGLGRESEEAGREDPEGRRVARHSSISVQSVNAGVVVLAGKASSMEAHLRAIEDARGVPGVRQVSSEVQSPDTRADEEIRRDEDKMARGEGRTGTAKGAISDSYITSATKLRLFADSKTPALDINVDTHRGVVTLFGMVPSSEAKAAAEADARKVSGVRRVVNRLQVVASAKQPEVKARDEDIEREVKKALDTRSGLSDARIKVDVKNGVARLTGTVRAEHDRVSAAVAARSAPGVRSVQDDLQISAR